MDEIEETGDSFGKEVAKTTVIGAATAFGLCAGMVAAGWLASHVRTNVNRVRINFETKTDIDTEEE
jgi:hypothetical protein